MGMHLGIPYAAAGRFERPRRAPAVDFATCTAFGPAPPQLPGDGLVPGAPVTDQDEDRCLSLNVWTPDASGDEARPVLVMFYGGAYMTGVSGQACFDGARLATEQDVVVVSANYRLGAFGFLDLRPFGGDVANLGLNDAVLALEWVRDNIAAFGGDPAHVTIFGESAGGGMCLHLLASPRTRGLIGGAIVQSGAADLTLDPARSESVTRTLAEVAGVNDFEGLRALSTDALLAAQGAALGQLIGSIGMMPFHPCVDGDLVPDLPVESLGAGVAAGVPLLGGTTADEMRLYLNPNAPPLDRSHLVRRIEKYVGVDTEGAEAIIGVYEQDAHDVWSGVFSDVSMVRPIRDALVAHAAHAPVYNYLFTWEAPGVGSAHAVDIPFMMGNFVDGWAEYVGHNDDAERVSTEMRDAWAAFARTGNPGWAQFPTTKIIGPDSAVVPEHPFTRRLAALDG